VIPAVFLTPVAKLAVATFALVVLSTGCVYVGYQWGSKALPEAVAAQQIDFTKMLTKRWEITDQFTVIYVDRIKVVQAETEIIIREVPKYVKDSCALSPGLRVYHDAAAQGRLPAAQ
jgi:hypothetical protein